MTIRVSAFCSVPVLAVLLAGTALPVQAQSARCGTRWELVASAGTLPSGRVLAERAVLARPVRHVSIVSPSGAFRVHFDTSGFHLPALLDAGGNRIAGTAYAYAESAAVAFDRSLEVIVHGLGYEPPPSDTEGGDSRYDVYVTDLGPDEFGETQFADPPLQTTPNTRYATWILVDNDFLVQRTRGLAGLSITAAHEYFHAVQLGSYGYWGRSETYWYELSSTWMEHQVFPSVGDYLIEAGIYLTQFGTVGLTATSTDFPGYERMLFAEYLADRFGTEVLRSVWEHLRGARVLPALRASMAEKGSSIERAYGEFARWTFFTADRSDPARYFVNGARFPRLTPAGQTALVGQEARVSAGFAPLSHALFAVRIDTDTMFVMLINTGADAASTSSPPLPATGTVVLSRNTQQRPSQRLVSGVTGGLDADGTDVWDLEYFSGSTRDVVARVGLAAFPNPWNIAGPHDLVVPTDAPAGSRVSVHFVTMDFRSVDAGDVPVTIERGENVVRVPASGVRDVLGSGACVLVIRGSGKEEMTKLIVVR